MYNYIYRIVDLVDFTNSFESDNLVDVMHEFISLLLTKQIINYDKIMVLKIKDCGSNKKFPFIINSYKYNYLEKRIYDNDLHTFIINNKIVLNLFNKLISLNNNCNLVNQSSVNQSSVNQSSVNQPSVNQSSANQTSIIDLMKNTNNLLSLNKELLLNSTSILPEKKVEPINENNDENNENNDENNDENNSEISNKIELLKEQLDKLIELKEDQLDNIDNVKDIIEQDKDKLANYYCDISTEKRILRMQKEKEEEKLRIFESDKKVYEKIKIDINKEKISEDNIPELFIKQYPILKFMDLNNLLNTDNDYDTYKSLYDEMYPKPTNKNDPYIPHNINYKNENKSHNIPSSLCDNSSRCIPSVDEILADLETDTDETESDDTESIYDEPNIKKHNTNNNSDETTELNNNQTKFTLASALLSSLN
jgi:hypothetical protein